MPAPDTIYRLRTRGTLNGQKVEFGVHMHKFAPAGSVAGLAAAWVTNTMPLVIAATSAQVNWDDLLISDVAVDGNDQVAFPLSQPNPGGLAGDVLPGQNAMLVSLRTGLKGGRHRGRLYLPGVTEASNANGTLTGAQLTAMQALAAGLISQWGPGGTVPNWRLVVFSPIDTTPPPPRKFKPKPDELTTDINVARVDPIIRSQRRRMIGVGI